MVDSDTTCCFWVHTLRQCPPLMITPADTHRRVALSPPQSASEYASSSLCCQRNQHFALGFPAKYLPILLTRCMSRTDVFAIAQHTCMDAKLRSGRSCDKLLIRARCALYFVMSPLVSAWLSLASSLAIYGLSLPSPSPCRPAHAWIESVLVGLVFSLASVISCIALILPFHGAWSRRVIRSFRLKILQYLPDMSLAPSRPPFINVTIRYSSTLLKGPHLLQSPLS